MALPPLRRVTSFDLSEGEEVSNSQKSKTPCLAGFKPVTSDIQAGGVTAGTEDMKSACTPSRWRRAKFGKSPRAISGRRIRKLNPSTPKMTARIESFSLLATPHHPIDASA